MTTAKATSELRAGIGPDNNQTKDLFHAKNGGDFKKIIEDATPGEEFHNPFQIHHRPYETLKYDTVKAVYRSGNGVFSSVDNLEHDGSLRFVVPCKFSTAEWFTFSTSAIGFLVSTWICFLGLWAEIVSLVEKWVFASIKAKARASIVVLLNTSIPASFILEQYYCLSKEQIQSAVIKIRYHRCVCLE